MSHHGVTSHHFLNIVEILRQYGKRHPHAHYAHPFPDEDVRKALLHEGLSEEKMARVAKSANGAKIHGRFGISARLLDALTKVLFREKT
ncbi:MAG TPA: hypothetical protein VHZ04_00955 [Candidatus Paceibacterota bacterium]|jgi:hypothetical protein|nr:hypothetical protein [Candidatus Paceibacterota bacterium]